MIFETLFQKMTLKYTLHPRPQLPILVYYKEHSLHSSLSFSKDGEEM